MQVEKWQGRVWVLTLAGNDARWNALTMKATVRKSTGTATISVSERHVEYLHGARVAVVM
jgi:hypothetical protein